MVNKTYAKYWNIYTVNRNYNDLFDQWLENHYEITVTDMPWSFGVETFKNKATGEAEDRAHVMQVYAKKSRNYFKDFDEVDQYLSSDMSIEEYFKTHK